MILSLIDHTATISADELTRVAGALTKQLWRDVCPAYGLAPVTVVAGPAQGAYELGLFLHSDQAGDLGYHSLTPANVPYSSVFLADCQADGDPWTACASHEAAEIAADPDCATLKLGGDGKVRCFEIADPCEDLAYQIDGVTLSDVVDPAWFLALGTQRTIGSGAQLAAGARTPGGYVQLWTPSGMVNDADRARKHRLHASSRAARRIAAHAAMTRAA